MENNTLVPPAEPLVPAPGGQNQSGTALPPVKELFLESYALMKKRLMVMILSSLQLIVSAIAVLVAVALVGFLAYKLVNTTAGIIVWIVFGLAWFVGYIYVVNWAAAAQLVALRDAEENTTTKENIKRSRQYAWSLLLINLILQLVVMGGVVLLIVPGIMLGLWYGFGLMALIVDGKKGRSALALSKAYVYGRSWKVLGRFALAGLMFIVPQIILQLLIQFNQGSFLAIIFQLAYMVLQVVFTYFMLAVTFTLYKQLKNTAGQVDSEKYIGGVTGWTVWGAIGGVLIIGGVLASIVILALSSARIKSRDAKRLADVKQVGSALELYYNDNQSYPNSLTYLVPTYIKELPAAPKPADGKCSSRENEYSYKSEMSGQDYALNFCLGQEYLGYAAGAHTASYRGISQ